MQRGAVRGAAGSLPRLAALSGRCYLAQQHGSDGMMHTNASSSSSYMLLASCDTASSTRARGVAATTAAAAAPSATAPTRSLLPASLSGNGYYAQRYAVATMAATRRRACTSSGDRGGACASSSTLADVSFVHGDVVLRLAHAAAPRRRVIDVTGVHCRCADAPERDARALLTHEEMVRQMHLCDGHDVPELQRGRVAIGRVCVYVVYAATSNAHCRRCADGDNNNNTAGAVVSVSRVRWHLRPLTNASELVSRVGGDGALYHQRRDSRHRGHQRSGSHSNSSHLLSYASHDEAMAIARSVAEHCVHAAASGSLLLRPVVRDGDVVALQLAPASHRSRAEF